MAVTQYSKVVGPTDSAADTETRIGGADIDFPGTSAYWTIRKIEVGYGSVVDAKSPVGMLEVKVKGINGPFKFAIGRGAGGAATTAVSPKEIIDNLAIPVPGVTGAFGVYTTMAEAAVDMVVTIWFDAGGSKEMPGITYSDTCTVNAATLADTEEDFGSVTLNPGNSWTISEIRVAMGAVVNAKAFTGKIYFKGGTLPSDMHQMGIGNGSSGATNAGHQPAEVIPIKIVQPGNVAITVRITTAEAAVDSLFSLKYS